MTLENKILDERLWYNMDYGVSMHEYFLKVMEPDNLYTDKMAIEVRDMTYLTTKHIESMKGIQYTH